MSRHIPIALTLAAAGCGTLPPVDYSYYPRTSKSTVAVTQTIDCTADKSALIITYGSPNVSTAFQADHSKSPYTFQVKKLDNAFADTDFSFNLTDDGRLKSINASSTGEGQVILSSAVSLGSGIAGLIALAATPGAPSSAVRHAALPECAAVKKWGGGKAVSLVYRGSANLASTDSFALQVSPDATSTRIHNELAPQLPMLQVSVSARHPIAPAASIQPANGTYPVWLTLNKTSEVDFDILADRGARIYSSSVIVPVDDTYTLPVPGAVIFGSQAFALTLNDAGGITAIDYGKHSGAAQPIEVVSGAVSAAAPTATTSTPTTTP